MQQNVRNLYTGINQSSNRKKNSFIHGKCGITFLYNQVVIFYLIQHLTFYSKCNF